MTMTFTLSDYNAVTNTSQELPIPMIPGFQYVLRADTDLYFKVGLTTATTASAADNSHFLPAFMPAYLAAQGLSKYVCVIRKSADGICTLSRLEPGSVS